MSTRVTRKGRRTAWLVATVAGAVGLFALAGNAMAFTCTYAAPDVTITLNNETVTVSKGAASAIAVNGVACGAATASNTDNIFVVGNGVADGLVIDEGGGRFEPGSDVEPAGINEIEFVIGTEGVAGSGVESLTILGDSSPDTITIGAGLAYPGLDVEQGDPDGDGGVEVGFVNLNDDEDADVFVNAGVDQPVASPITARGRGGNDHLSGKGQKGTGGTATADLVLDGGDGDDWLQGGDGDDTLIGGAGNDTMDGDANSAELGCLQNEFDAVYVPTATGDTVSYAGSTGPITADLDPAGHPGSATGDGTDVLQNVENLIGSPAGDTLSGNDGTNIIQGGAGDDVLAGDAGDDCVLGEGGNDTLNENEGVALAEGGDGTDNGADALSGGAGSDDVIDYSGRSTRVVVNLGVISWFNDGADQNADSVSNECDDVYFDTENAVGGSGNDLLSADYSNNQSDNEFTGGAGNDSMEGGAGNDTFHEGSAASGSDAMEGDAGSDTVDYSGRSNSVNVSLDGVSNDGEAGEGDNAGAAVTNFGPAGCATGDDLFEPYFHPVGEAEPFAGDEADDNVASEVENVDGGSGADQLVGNEAGNILNGNAGNDTLNGGGSTDTLNGGDGDDTLAGGGANDALNGGEGTDTADYGSVADEAGVNVNLTTGVATGEGNDTLSGLENVNGSSFADAITGDAGNNVLNGRGGNDAIQGGAGDDTVNAGSGADVVSGGAGNDTIRGAGGTDTLRGNAGDDSVAGDAGADTVYGNKGDDSLKGGAGKDLLLGGPGSDACQPGSPGLANGDRVKGCEA